MMSSKFSCDKTAYRCNTLLAIEDLKVATGVNKINQTKRVSLEYRINDGYVFNTITVNIITLVLRLDHWLAIEAVEEFSFECVIHKPFENFSASISKQFLLH